MQVNAAHGLIRNEQAMLWWICGFKAENNVILHRIDSLLNLSPIKIRLKINCI